MHRNQRCDALKQDNLWWSAPYVSNGLLSISKARDPSLDLQCGRRLSKIVRRMAIQRCRGADVTIEFWRTRPGQPAWKQERQTLSELMANLRARDVAYWGDEPVPNGLYAEQGVLRARLRRAMPMMPKPATIIAQLAGSGTAVTVAVMSNSIGPSFKSPSPA